MKNLSEYITERIGDRLGRGMEGEIYDEGNGRVRKVFHNGKVPISYQLLKSASEHGDVTALPKVYEVGDDYIIREGCKPTTIKCREYWSIANSKPFNNDLLWRMVQAGDWWYDPDEDKVCSRIRAIIRGRLKEVIEWLCHLKYEISQVKGDKFGLGDFALKNLGETDDGRVVLMDF